jgi:hypothetical protein
MAKFFASVNICRFWFFIDRRVTLVLVSLLFIGCAKVNVVRDPGTNGMTVANRFLQYHRLSLAFVNQTVIDSDGNTLSRERLRDFFRQNGDQAAIEKLDHGSGERTLINFGSFVLGLICLHEIFGRLESEISDQQVRNEATYPYAAFAATFIGVPILDVFGIVGTDESRAVNLYNENLSLRLGLNFSSIEMIGSVK